MLQAASAAVAAAGAEAEAEASGGDGVFWYVLAGTLAGTAWRSTFWVTDAGQFLKVTAYRDVMSTFGLFVLSMATVRYLGWTGWPAAGVAFMGAMIGIEIIRRTVLRAWDAWVRSWTPQAPKGDA